MLHRPLKVVALAGLGLALLLAFAPAASARAGGDRLQIGTHHRQLPYEYAVKKGDTLWGIASRFLKNPWKWPQLWERNPYITNPDLIYPGDLLIFDARNGILKLRVVRATPQTKVLPLPLRAIPVVRRELILPFLSQPGVIDSKRALEQLPYIVSDKHGRQLFAPGDVVYAEQIGTQPAASYDIVRVGPALIDPDTRQNLGYRLERVGTAERMSAGPLARLRITQSSEEIRPGDRLMAYSGPPDTTFLPRLPAQTVSGRILAGEHELGELGQWSVAIVDRGRQSGLQPGDVLRVYRQGLTVKNPVTGMATQLPETTLGTAMVFRSFPRVSYVLILTSNDVIHPGDGIRSPASGAGAPVGIGEWRSDGQ